MLGFLEYIRQKGFSIYYNVKEIMKRRLLNERRSFKCQSHWTHIIQNKDSLFVKCCLLSESLATTHRAPQPRPLRKPVSGSISRGGSAPRALLREEGNPLIRARYSQMLHSRLGAAANRERPGIEARVPPCSCGFGILFSHSAQGVMGQNSASSPLYSVMGTSLPVEMLAEVEPGCARPMGGLSGRFTKEGLEKEKPLKQSPARSMLLKDIRKGTQLAVNNFLQLFFDVQGNYPLHKIRHERFRFQCLQVLSNKKNLCRNDRFHVHLYFQSWVLLVQIFQKYSFCLFLDSSERRLLCYKL